MKSDGSAAAVFVCADENDTETEKIKPTMQFPEWIALSVLFQFLFICFGAYEKI